jgi:phenylacetate-coenzyme A ligase PaaK-like adenylate-forming protein
MGRFDLELGIRLWRLRRELLTHESWSRERLLAYQDARLRRLRSYAYAHSPFYRRSHSGMYDRPLSELPVLTKQGVAEAFDEIVTDRSLRYRDLEAFVSVGAADLFAGRYIVISTSGSAGRPSLFVYDVREWAYVLASLGRGADWAGLDAGTLHRRRVATVGTKSPWHMSNRAAVTLPSWWLPTKRLDVTAPVERLAADLDRWQPDLLVTYGSIVGILAAAHIDGGLGMAPRAVICGADALSSDARRRAQEAWGRRVFEQYAATETAGIASECDVHAGLHVNEDLLVLESVDDDYQPVPTGTAGTRLLVTVLFGRTLPLIRYELPDGVRLVPGSCACGRPFARIAGVEGRVSEALELDRAAGGRVMVHAVVIHEVMDIAGVAAWQLVQERERLRLRIVPAAGRPDEAGPLAQSLQSALARTGAVVPPIVVERVGAIERGAGGKVPLIKPLQGRAAGPQP